MNQTIDGASASQIHPGLSTARETTSLRPLCNTLGVNVP